MSVAGLRKAGKKYATQYARVTIVSFVAATVVAAVVGAVRNGRPISVLPQWIDLPQFVRVFVLSFVLFFIVGLLVRLLKQHSTDLKQLWEDRLGGPLVERWNGLARRTQAIISGVLAAVAAGVGTAVAGFVYTVPSAVIGGACLLAWPVGTYWALRQRPSVEGTSGITGLVATRSRYGELRHLETRTVALLIGFVIGAASGSGLWLLGVDTAVTATIATLVWLAATVIVYNRYETVLMRRTELAIVSTESITADDEIELTIKNRGRETVELVNPTLRDTTHEHYQFTEELGVQPGGKTTLKLPSTFTVSTTTAERTLPLGYTLDRSQDAPIVYSQTGSAFELQQGRETDWPETNTEYGSQSRPGHTITTSDS